MKYAIQRISGKVGGVHPKIVQERLGHPNTSMPLNRYSHVTSDMQRFAAETLDAAFTKVS
jgi:hypothetical protein